jgi:hypothetical protein
MIVYEGPLSFREVALAQGADALPIWITETGREAIVGDAAGLEAQRLYVQRVLDAMDARPWYGGTIFYELSEEHPGGMWPDIHWGLALRVADPDGTYADNFQRKPAFDYLKLRLATPPLPTPDAGPGGGTADAGAGGDGGGSSGDGGAGADGGSGGCGCHVAARQRGGGVGALFLAALALAVAAVRGRSKRLKFSPQDDWVFRATTSMDSTTSSR